MNVLLRDDSPRNPLLQPLTGEEMLLLSRGPEMRSYEPTLRERVGNRIYDAASAVGLGSQANRMRDEGTIAADFLPGIGDAIAFDDAGAAYGRGDYGQAALAGTAGLLGTIPGAGDAAAGMLKAIFGGIAAKTADRAALAKAQDMAEAGVDRARIWNETGWFRGPDGQWRFEIDDSGSQIGGKAYDELMAGGDHGATQRTAAGTLWHPELYRAYPETRNIDVDARYNQSLASPSGSYRQDYLGDNGGRARIEVSSNAVEAEPRSVEGILLHELQHGVQMQEGFARGAHPAEYASGAMFHQRARELQGDLSRALTGGLSAKPAEILQNVRYADQGQLAEIAARHGFPSIDEALDFLRIQDEMRTPMSQYRRTSGEVEARNVQTRMHMTPEQRRATPPWATQDVPDDMQIIRHR